MVLCGISYRMPMPCPKHGLTGDPYLILMPKPCPRHGLTRDLISDAHAMSQIWSYRGSHSDANAMFQTWSYLGSQFGADAMSPTWYYTGPTNTHDMISVSFISFFAYM
ncbi:hypothetical protein J1N35_007791 [Gossypium stocksii]|uniref:Uncharacterized protein n=1 Tax=Gossypium stocksii TaxID=47602 RepID=A0A9D3W841_9ROSI|nr:hypothetical protein J1N35_007791 [Gossypium stocksii]